MELVPYPDIPVGVVLENKSRRRIPIHDSMQGVRKERRNDTRMTCSRTAFMCARQLLMLASGRRLESGEDLGTALSGTSLPRTPSMNSTRMPLRAACTTMPSRRSDRDGRPTTNIFSNCNTVAISVMSSPHKQRTGETRAKGTIADSAHGIACCDPWLAPVPQR
jgi:hypothetical protein